MMDPIEGVKIDVEGTELREQLESRATYHAAKAEQYRQQIAGLGDLIQAGIQSNDPRQEMDRSAKSHLRKAQHFHFMATHVSEDATYRLAERDLILIEIIDQGW